MGVHCTVSNENTVEILKSLINPCEAPGPTINTGDCIVFTVSELAKMSFYYSRWFYASTVGLHGSVKTE